jgi:hypothetical protein
LRVIGIRQVAAILSLVASFPLSAAGWDVQQGDAGRDSTKTDAGAPGRAASARDTWDGPRSIHCLQAVLIDSILMRQELWTRGDCSRFELLQVGDSRLESPVITMQVKGSLYTFGKGGLKGTRTDLPDGLARLPLLKQFERVRHQGQRTGSVEIDGAAFGEKAGMLKLDVYHYAAAAESVEAWFNPLTLVPVRWLSRIRVGDSLSQGLMIFASVEINVPIPDSLLELPKGITFSR